MRQYIVEFKYSNNGANWSGTTRTINSDSDIGVISQVKGMYRHVKEIRIVHISNTSGMRTYIVEFKYSQDGRNWSGSTRTIKADSDYGAMIQIENMFLYVSGIRIVHIG